MIVSLGGNGMVDHKDEGKVREILQQLHDDLKGYAVNVYYSVADGVDNSVVEFVYTDENGKRTYSGKTIRD